MCRKLIYLIVVLAVVPTTAQIAQAQFITSVTHRNTDADAPEDPEIAPNPLDEDELCFVDRTHQYNEIPAYLIGADYVLTANDNKNVSSYELDVTLSATIPEGTKLYLFLDNRMGAAAGGLGVDPDLSGMPWVANMGFTDTGDDIGIDEDGDGDIDQYSSVFSLAVTPGTITLGGCTEGHGGNMYGAAVMGPRLKARDPDPADGAQNVTLALLQWTAGDTAAFHDVYFGTDPDALEFMARKPRQQALYYHSPGITPGTTYYWRVDEVEADDTTVHTGDVWSFSVPSSTAYDPVPADGADLVSTEVELSWTAGFTGVLHDVYFGTDETEVTDGTGDTFKSRWPLTTFSPGTLAEETTYYWRIDEIETDMTTKHKGEVWSFTTVPDIPISDPNLLLWWKLDEGAGRLALDWSGHDHHGTLADDPQWVEGTVGGALEFDGAGDRVVDDDAEDFLNGLDAITVCMWIKSDLVGTDRGFINCEQPDGSDSFVTMRYDNAGGNSGNDDCLKMAVTTTSGESQLESSSNTQTTEWQHVAMTWSDGGLTRFYMNAVEDTGADRNNPNNTGTISGCSTLIIGAGAKDETTATQGWDGLIDDVRIYDKALTAEEIKEAMRGDTSLAWDPNPAHRSTTDVEKAVPLSWSPGEKAAQHDVYLGTDQTAVKNADASDTTGIYRGRHDPNTYTPPEGVEFGQTYYWRIDEFNTDATLSKGSVWSFAVANYLIVDDFEDYDDFCNRIFFTWTDGWGHSGDPDCGVPSSLGNGTGSTVGNLNAPFAEQTIVHSGGQSMPFEYNNSGTGGKARYSEAQREWASPQDWTRKAVKALTVYFYGDPANAAEQLYVAVEDNTGQVRVVNHPNPDAAQAAGWQEWNIALTQFSGVNLNAVKKLCIGLGNRVSPAAGGSGKIYIDDIRLHQPRCVASVLKPEADFTNDCVVDYSDLQTLANNWLRIIWDTTGGPDGSGSLVFGPTGDYVAIEDLHYAGTSFTQVSVSAWIRTASEADQYIISFDRNEYYRLEINGSGAGPGQVGWDVMTVTDGTEQQLDYGSVTRVDDDQWHHVVGVFDNGTATIYIDGTAEPSATGGPIFGTGETRFGFLGANSEATEFDGARGGGNPIQHLDDLRVYDYALAAADVTGLAQGTADPAIGPILWYQFDETSGDMTADASGNGYDGHLVFGWFDMNLHDDDVLNFKDFALVADQWLDKLLWPQP